ncbi:uncharacterized protein LOC123014557 [Tribolium madens]|uniref:uncharacterized protein LOC123014557 n=1 Tax=Tribolium madens TaxID=41895 RepID=UPI001CF75C8A|nr:uncharacterized protein LOC123014557 [Tribolium madens]XP_044269665.1 uncharacterized protein LOC123014557 [Tribolium madens]
MNMLKLLLFFLFYFLSDLCNARNVGENGRFFGYTYTSTVVKSNVVTSLVPSSCVQVEPTLPPCRSVRFLRLPKLPSITFNYPSSNRVISNISEPELKTTALGWGEYFGLYAPTVTVTRTDLHITTVEDPSVVVTYAVKGCRPLKLPLDLDRCPEERSTFSIEEILATSTVLLSQTETFLPTKTMTVINPSSTVYQNLPNFSDEAHFQDNVNSLEPSGQEQVENGPSRATQALRKLQ